MTEKTKFIGDLIKNKKTSDTVFIIGGGPSLLKYLPDTSILDKKDIICTNNAYKLFPNAMITHFADRAWYEWHIKPKHDILNKFYGSITTCALSQRGFWTNTNVECFAKGDPKGGISKDIEKLNGNNAGNQAINLAVHMRYKTIVLLGFDLDASSKKTHWHSEHERPTNVGNYDNGMIPGFEKIPQFERELGFKVYNINKESKLRCFEFIDLNEILH